MDAGINNVIYMELYLGPKMANGTCGKTIITGTIDRGSTVIDNPESVEVVSSITGDNLVLLLTEQSNLYHSQNEEKWKVLPKTLKCSNITPEDIRTFLGLII